MIKKRLIAVITVLNGQVVQSEQFKHDHVIHSDAIHAVESFSRWDVDEIVMLNISKDRTSRDEFADIVEHVSKVCFVPLTAGGFVEDEAYAAQLIKSGADKLILNTVFFNSPGVGKAIAARFGRQCLVASIDVKSSTSSERLVYVDRGTASTGEKLENWVVHCESNGAGEIFINNIEHDGNRKGFDILAIKKALNHTTLPIIAFGGAFHDRHFAEGLEAGASAVAAANIFHYKEMATKQVKRYLKRKGFNVREQ